jgi:outer membrane protein OmpA-like peptidoglycan-associated protein
VRARVPVLALTLAAMSAAGSAAAEPLGSHLEITPFGGYTLFDAQMRPNFNDYALPGYRLDVTSGPALRDAVYMGARIGWHPRSWFGFEVATGVAPTSQDLASGQDVNLLHASGNVMFTPMARRAGGPFLSIGGGAVRLDPSSAEAFNQGTLELAAGVRLWMTDAVGLRLEARDMHWLPKDGFLGSADYVTLGAGLTVALGGTPRDTDGDGVRDKLDRCPDTPRGARVDASGCPLDSDGDKVFDGLDRCDGTPHGCTVDANGCPTDADGDGVCDGVDQCADTPRGATVDARGCPTDSDGDQVFDGLDQCADTPKGCTVDAKGCPSDADGDGVCDGLDRCPDTSPGLKVDKDGCPIELIERETELLDTGMIRLQNINFATAKADVLAESYPALDVVGQVLTKWPELRIEVGGHTDSRGSDAYNRRLSQARADSVLSYIQRKFPALKAEQFTVKGYGESVPLVPNTSELNWAKNRRVEFVVLNKDVLRREVERRRLLRIEESAPRDTVRPPAPIDTLRQPALPDTTRK